MELSGLKNTREEELEMREREREMFVLFFFKTIATEDHMESNSSAAVIFWI